MLSRVLIIYLIQDPQERNNITTATCTSLQVMIDRLDKLLFKIVLFISCEQDRYGRHTTYCIESSISIICYCFRRIQKSSNIASTTNTYAFHGDENMALTRVFLEAYVYQRAIPILVVKLSLSTVPSALIY